jgi:hypothetical protein
MGAFHLTEIPEILLENQMEHVNFWNAVSKIPDNRFLEVVHKLEIPQVSKFLHALKHFPTTLLLSKGFFEQNKNGGFSTISVPRVWIYFGECWKKRCERQCQILQN